MPQTTWNTWMVGATGSPGNQGTNALPGFVWLGKPPTGPKLSPPAPLRNPAPIPPYLRAPPGSTLRTVNIGADATGGRALGPPAPPGVWDSAPPAPAPPPSDGVVVDDVRLPQPKGGWTATRTRTLSGHTHVHRNDQTHTEWKHWGLAHGGHATGSHTGCSARNVRGCSFSIGKAATSPHHTNQSSRGSMGSAPLSSPYSRDKA
jgi:hypothetical protein